MIFVSDCSDTFAVSKRLCAEVDRLYAEAIHTHCALHRLQRHYALNCRGYIYADLQTIYKQITEAICN